MKVLVTGAAGFIGFHLCRRLLADGHAVTGYDGLTPYYDVALKRARLAILEAQPGYTGVTAMLEDVAALERAGEACRPDVIVHLAAQAGVRYSLENPRAYVDSNLVGSWNVIDLATRLKPRHLMLASTSSLYGAAETVPFAETDMADRPLTLYAASKKAMEGMAHAAAHLHGLPTTAFRFFTVYGPWGRPDMALFKFTRAILAGEPIEIYGEGRMQRDFTYVEDLVEAVTRLIPVAPAEANRAAAPDGAAVDSLSPVAPFRVVNIGGGNPVGLIDFVETVERQVGRPAIRTMLPMQPGDVPRTFASPRLLEALTGYRPSTGLDAGVAAFVAWYRGYAGL